MRIIRIKKHKIEVTLNSFLLGLYFIMPFVDFVSGAFHDIYPIGQIYRIVIYIYMLMLLAKNSKKKFVWIIVPFLIFLIIQSIVSITYLIKSVQDVIKLFIPITAITLFDVLIKKQKLEKESIFKLLDAWSIFYPLLIIIPGILGIGTNAYDGAVGWKGFFYAVNEISFIMSSLVMYLFWKLQNKIDIKTLIVLGINCICIVLMGTKTGYVTIAFFGLVFLISFIRERNLKKQLKAWFLLVIAVVLLFISHKKIQELTTGIFERWKYQRGLSYSTVDFLFSMRLRRWKDAVTTFTNGFHIVFGWGLGGEQAGFPNLEMDFFDLLFRTGLIGFCYICVYYYRKVKVISKNNLWGLLILLWSLVLSFGAGHVLFYGQSGMMLAISFVYASLIGGEKIFIKNE